MINSNRGFTLIEVILAIILFAMAAVLLIQPVVDISNGLAQFNTDDILDADIRFVRRTVLAIESRDELETGDDIETLNSGHAVWEVEIEETEIVDLFILDLTIILDGEERKDEPYHYALYVLRPAWSEAGERSALLNDKRQKIESVRNF